MQCLAVPVDLEKHERRDSSCALVTLLEGMVLCDAIEERRGQADDIPVPAHPPAVLWTRYRAFQQAFIEKLVWLTRLGDTLRVY